MDALGGGGLGDILSLFTGGAFTRASIFALGIMPYISASIIIQLMSIAVPNNTEDAEGGRKRKKEDYSVHKVINHRDLSRTSAWIH